MPPIAGAAVDGRREELVAADGTRFAAYTADAVTPSGAAMLILPDVRGLHPYFEELALRFAEAGIDALAIDYFGRTAGTGERGPDFDHQPHVGATEYESLMADAKAGADALRARPSVRAMFYVGFCFGGRLALLAGTRTELGAAGVIGFYGWPVGEGRAGTPAPAAVASDMRSPVLALFGGADRGIPATAVDEFRDALDGANVESEIVTYDGAPHSFFDRKAGEFAEASADAWRRALEFVGRHTPAAEGRAA